MARFFFSFKETFISFCVRLVDKLVRIILPVDIARKFLGKCINRFVLKFTKFESEIWGKLVNFRQNTKIF